MSKIDHLLSMWNRLDQFVIRFLSRYSVFLLRLALGITFIWFGALKILGLSPVANLVSQTVYWFSPKYFVPFLGIWEVAVGLGLLFKIALRVTIFLFLLQMAGTFMVIVFHPEVSFQSGNPLLLTVTGEFVIKNLVLISAGLVVGSTVRQIVK